MVFCSTAACRISSELNTLWNMLLQQQNTASDALCFPFWKLFHICPSAQWKYFEENRELRKALFPDAEWCHVLSRQTVLCSLACCLAISGPMWPSWTAISHIHVRWSHHTARTLHVCLTKHTEDGQSWKKVWLCVCYLFIVPGYSYFCHKAS